MKTLIENSFALSTNLLKKDLKKAREKINVDGYLNIVNQGRPSVIDYSIEYQEDCTYLVIVMAEEPQKILLVEKELTFGMRTFLSCGCGALTNALYLKQQFFACRVCQSLSYSSNRINRNSDHGYMLYQNSKRLKLMEMREGINRIFYNNQYTKRFSRFLKLCGQAGLTREVRDAQELMGAIKASRTQRIATNSVA